MCIYKKFSYAIKIYLGLTVLIFPFFSFAQENQQPKVNISGVLKLDLIYDIDTPSGDRINYAQIPTNGSNGQGQMRLHARESRLKISTSKNVLGKKYTTILEGDFYGGGSDSPEGSENISNSVSFRLRHAYISSDQWLIGQTWSNYVDIKSFPETLDFSNDTGQSFIRQGQIRYQHKVANFLLSYSLENPETDVDILNNTIQEDAYFSTIDPIFDVTAKAKYQSSWGHISLQTVIRKHKVYSNYSSIEDTGYGVGGSGKIQLTPKSLIKFHYSQGLGIGRYIQEAAGAAGIITQSSNSKSGVASLMLLKAKGGYLSYQHAFNKTLRVNMSSGFMHIDYPPINVQPLISSYTKNLTSFHANIIWSVMPDIDIGIEHSIVNLKTVAGDLGNIKRVQLSTKVRF